MSFRIDEPVVMVGTAALVLWLCSERLMQFLGLRQPKPDKPERLSSYWHTLSFYGAVVFPLLDVGTCHWSTVGPGLAPFRWVGVPLLLAGIAVLIIILIVLIIHFFPPGYPGGLFHVGLAGRVRGNKQSLLFRGCSLGAPALQRVSARSPVWMTCRLRITPTTSKP